MYICTHILVYIWMGNLSRREEMRGNVNGLDVFATSLNRSLTNKYKQTNRHTDIQAPKHTHTGTHTQMHMRRHTRARRHFTHSFIHMNSHVPKRAYTHLQHPAYESCSAKEEETHRYTLFLTHRHI